MLVFAIDDLKGYNVMEARRSQILQIKQGVNPPILLVGNKCDLASHRQVAQADAQALAASWNINYLESSAKVLLIFDHLLLGQDK